MLITLNYHALQAAHTVNELDTYIHRRVQRAESLGPGEAHEVTIIGLPDEASTTLKARALNLFYQYVEKIRSAKP